jgi:ketopantoate reductase
VPLSSFRDVASKSQIVTEQLCYPIVALNIGTRLSHTTNQLSLKPRRADHPTSDYKSGESVKICILGAGAIGGLIAVRLALSGEDVCVIDRGAHLSAIRSNGIKLRWENGTTYATRLPAFESAAHPGRQDLVVLAVKAYDLTAAAEIIKDLLDAETMVMTVQNGIPWWYFQNEGGKFDGRPLVSLDPNGILTSAIPAERIIGCVAYPAAVVTWPSVVHHIECECFPIGDLNGRNTARLHQISEAFTRAGLKSRVISDIRSEIWLKALGNLSLNPISALTRATMVEICRFPDTRQLAIAMMLEAKAIAQELGIVFRHTIEERLEGAEKVGAHKTSMLQDLEAGRPLETEALLGAILEMGRLTSTSAPTINALYSILKLRENAGKK